MRSLALAVTLALLTAVLIAPGAAAEPDPNCSNDGRVRVCQEGYYCDFERGVCGYEWLCVYVGVRGVCIPWAPNN